MKILQIIFSLSSGGAERFVVDLSNELSKTNEVTLLTLKDDTVDAEKRNFYKFDLSSNVKYINLGLADGIHVSYPLKIYKVIKSIKPDIVHLHLQGVLLYCYLSVLLLGRSIKFIETIHSDVYGGGYNSRFRHFVYYTLLLRNKFQYVGISTTSYQQIRKEYPGAKCQCIFNGRAIIKPTSQFEEVKNEINGLKDNSKTQVLIHIARCHPVKNQMLLIRSFNNIRTQGRNAILLVIGSNYESNIGQELKSVAGSGIFFGGERKNISDYLLNSDIFVLSSRYEGMPITLIEAILSGMPIVSTPVTGAVDVINGKNGVISEDYSERSYISALNEMINNFDSYKKEAMKEKENSPYTIQKCAEQYVNLYKS